jgi:hypothetical protein
MAEAIGAFEGAIRDAEAARKIISRAHTPQIRGSDQIAMLKTTAQTWFKTHRFSILSLNLSLDISSIDALYNNLLLCTEKSTTRNKYLTLLKELGTALSSCRSNSLVANKPDHLSRTDDQAPDFSRLTSDKNMALILNNRWDECVRCVQANAHLAAIVMMGGLLEALFVARANLLQDKSSLVGATHAPKDKNGKTINLNEWMLDSYIKVANELEWITDSARGASDTLKEYRNFIHPAKELRYKITLELNDSDLLWQITKALSRQLLLSIK